MSGNSIWETLENIISEYVELLQNELAVRWDNWKIDLVNRERYEVVGGLLARQVTLATQLAIAPSTWNGHFAPIIFRTMIDTHITLACDSGGFTCSCPAVYRVWSGARKTKSRAPKEPTPSGS